MTGADLLAAEIGDPEATRTVIAIVALLCVMGVALIMLAFWLRRVTRPDPELLAPLELMGERSWRRGDPVGQRRRLDDVRPQHAEPLTRAAAPPKFDEAFDAGPSAPGFDDLRPDADRPDGDRSDGDRPGDDAGGARGATPPDGRQRPDDDALDAFDALVDGDAEVGEVVAVADDVVAESTGWSGPDEDVDDEPSSRTPMSTDRPTLDDFLHDLPDGDIDPDALARAQAELDAELRQRATET